MNVRRATEADEAVLRELWEQFEAEVPEPDGYEPETWEDEWKSLRKDMAEACVCLAEDGGETVGMLDARAADGGRWHIETVHVKEGARRRGVATALVTACAGEAREHGFRYLSLGVLASNDVAQAVWRRLGFEPVELVLGQPLDALEERLENTQAGPSYASTHVQSDDRVSVERAVSQFVPRLQAPTLDAEANGWIRVADSHLDADRDAQGRLAAELSDRLGAVVVALAVEQGAVVRFRLYERGLMVDEYLSVPTFYGELPKGDELALAANPTLVARLTGADREQVRRIARTAESPADLPPADELYAQIARLMGLER